jgi:hypothetical protein
VLAAGKPLLVESANVALLSLDFGTCPFVTASAAARSLPSLATEVVDISTQPFRVVIISAGVAVPVFTYWLARISASTPLAIILLGRSPVPCLTGQAVDISGPVVKIIQKMGLEPTIRAARTTGHGMHKLNSAARVTAMFNAQQRQQAVVQAFTSEFEILRADLRRVGCEDAGRRSGMSFVYGNYVTGLTQDAVCGTARVQFVNGKLPAGKYDRVVGVDSALSVMRPFVTGHPAQDELHDIGISIAHFTISPEKHDSPTDAKFIHAPGMLTVLFRTSSAGTGVLLFSSADPALAVDDGFKKHVNDANFAYGSTCTTMTLAHAPALPKSSPPAPSPPSLDSPTSPATPAAIDQVYHARATAPPCLLRARRRSRAPACVESGQLSLSTYPPVPVAAPAARTGSNESAPARKMTRKKPVQQYLSAATPTQASVFALSLPKEDDPRVLASLSHAAEEYMRAPQQQQQQPAPVHHHKHPMTAMQLASPANEKRNPFAGLQRSAVLQPFHASMRLCSHRRALGRHVP